MLPSESSWRSFDEVLKGRSEFDDDQPRGADGRWSDEGGGVSNTLTPADITRQGGAVERERQAISAYRSDALNNVLRGLRKPETELGMTEKDWIELPKALDAYIAAHTTTKDAVVWRGVTSDPGLVAGEVVTDLGYLSTTLSLSTAERFARGGVVAEIFLPRGTNIAPIPFSDEQEYLLPRHTHLAFRGWVTRDSKHVLRFDAIKPTAKGYPEYDDDQPRGEDGRWSGGSGSGTVAMGPAQRLLAANLKKYPTPSREKFLASLKPEERTWLQRTLNRLKGLPATHLTPDEGGFRNRDGTWVASRAALHDVIIKTRLAEAMRRAMPEDGQQPHVVIIGGRPASGKTPAVKDSGFVPDVNEYLYINADDLRGDNKLFRSGDLRYGLPGYEGWNSTLYHAEASMLAERLADEARALGLNVVQDATLRKVSNAQAMIDAYEDAGYRMSGLFVHSPPGVTAYRVLNRAMRGSGRFVPSYVLGKAINERAFDAIRNRLDEWRLYDNTVFGTYKLVARGRGRRTRKGNPEYDPDQPRGEDGKWTAGGGGGGNDDPGGLKQYITMVDRIHEGKPSLFRLQLEHGKAYSAEGAKFTGSKSTQHKCYKCAAEAAMANPDLTYVEGFISVHGVPLSHAWTVDKDGRVHDPTLRDGKGVLGYYGIPFKTSYMVETLVRRRIYGLLEFNSAVITDDPAKFVRKGGVARIPITDILTDLIDEEIATNDASVGKGIPITDILTDLIDEEIDEVRKGNPEH